MALNGSSLFGDEGVFSDNEDISKGGISTENMSFNLAVESYTLNHTQSGNIIDIFNSDNSTYLGLNDGGVGPTRTTTLILDFGKAINIRNTMIYFSLRAGGTHHISLRTSYSLDNSNWTQIDFDSCTSSTEKFYNHYLTSKRYRYLKLEIETNNSISNSNSIKLINISTYR